MVVLLLQLHLHQQVLFLRVGAMQNLKVALPQSLPQQLVVLQVQQGPFAYAGLLDERLYPVAGVIQLKKRRVESKKPVLSFLGVGALDRLPQQLLNPLYSLQHHPVLIQLQQQLTKVIFLLP